MSELRYTQNFLKSGRLVEKIVRMAGIEPGMTVLEIGPGKGIITRELARRVGANGRVVVVELDPRLATRLQSQFASSPTVEVVHADILQFDLSKMGDDYRIVSNVPFNITSDLLSHLLNPASGPVSADLILQIDALIGRNKAGDPTETFKSLLIQPLYTIDVRHRFKRSDFTPQPGVETALFGFQRRDELLVSAEAYPLYADFLAFVSKDRVGEGNWRKLFGNRPLAGLEMGRGLKAQTLDGVLAAFRRLPASRHHTVTGTLANLRTEQQRRVRINRAGGHHRSKTHRR